MTLRDLQARHARGILTDAAYTGEELTYQFRDGSPDRTIRAQVTRLLLEPEAGASQVARLRARVRIPIDDTVGVTAVAKGDRVVLPMRLGETPVAARIRQVVSQGNGFVTVEVEQ